MIKFSDIPQFPTTKHRETVELNRIPQWIEKEKQAAAELDYDFDMSPPYQRDFVWTVEQKQSYLEYLLQGGKSGLDVFWNMPGYISTYPSNNVTARMELVDGKQRINAVSEFLNNRVPVFGKYFAQDFEHQRFPVNFTFHVLELPPADVVRFYIGFNAGGSVHTAAEIGKAKFVLAELTGNLDTSFASRKKNKEDSDQALIYQEIIDLAKHI